MKLIPGNIDMSLELSGECVISSVLSHHNKDLKQWTSVTARLQLSFIQQAKESTPSSVEGGLTQKERPQSILDSSYSFVSLPLSLHYANWAAKKGVFASCEVFTPVHRFSFVPFSQAFFPLPLPPPFLTLFPSLIPNRYNNLRFRDQGKFQALLFTSLVWRNPLADASFGSVLLSRGEVTFASLGLIYTM